MTDEAVCTETQKIPSLPDGAYALKEVELTEKGQVTVQLRDQLKIYTNNRFMFAFVHPEYGIDVGAGIATWKNSVMVEEPRVNQKGAVNGLTFDIDIKHTPAGFSQTLLGMTYEDGRCLDMVESWVRASSTISPFDGLWQLKEANRVKTKIIGGGHFICLETVYKEGISDAVFWFGTCTFNNDAEALETVLSSSNQKYIGAHQTLKVALTDDANFSQTFILDGAEVIEPFLRM
ncbi:hypothetical protein OAT92_01405 [Porticoccaceae bacterium]|jgi:hypothetical protein|nr:hypothetical protein [Porticoccaceae bacterium]MBT7565038.1 hypothetical protein [Porticoccaceae bacterium]MDB3884329.1 hypothetical protein [Porticoccaceae bacterium]MDC3199237.1 hypothetical protein [Porticoccaceae bacterium]MDC3259088.1 hypothetical protein [Porticoccaceae bacterium]